MNRSLLMLSAITISLLSVASAKLIEIPLEGDPPSPTLSFAQIRMQENDEREDKLRQEIKQLLTVQTAAWNKGDLVEFMSTYWKSKKLSFSSGGQTTYGWQATLDRYRKGYAPPKEMGKLHFDHLEVSTIENNSALVLGQWHLKMKDDSVKEGNFSLVLKKIDNQWKIIHDHSSIKEPDEK